MAQKSGSFIYQWWVPNAELEEEMPTAFLIRQMGKKDFDIVRYKQQMSAMLPMVLKAMKGLEDEESLTEELAGVTQSIRAEDGFDGALYGRCVKEIKNVYFKGEFVESLTDPKDIISWIAGLEDPEVSEELDDVLWRRSTLTPFETANFTPTSGYNVVCRTADGDQTSEA